MAQKQPNPWYVAILSGMVSYLDAGAIVTTGTALVIFRQSFGIDDLQYGLLSALLTVSIGVGALIGGPAGDRLGRKPVFMTTLALYVVGAILMISAPGVEMLYPGILLLGFASGADLPVSMAMIAEAATDRNRGKMVTFTHILWMGAVIVVGFLGTAVGNMGLPGARIMYAHLGVIALVVLILRIGLPESQAWVNSRNIVLPGTTARKQSAFRLLLTPRYLTAMIATGLFYALANIAANTNGQFGALLYVEVAGATVSTASLVSTLVTFVSVAALFLMMRVVDGRRRMVWFAAMSVLALVAFLVPPTFGITVATLVVFGVLYSISGAVAGEPMFKVWAQELFPTQIRATSQAIMIAFTRFVAAGVGVFTPSLITLGPNIVFYFMAATSVVACAIGIFWIARMPKATDDDQALLEAEASRG
ncbi:MFS transporter [Microbacterium indicum]|uniref:MFS transporter n=1 Tax=Microbacterium indicum TaxID=358100 RepID=UPI0004181D63|nr:MFS transporter [Microbacterium indicum]